MFDPIKLLRTDDLYGNTLPAAAPFLLTPDLTRHFRWTADDLGLSLALTGLFALSWLGFAAWRQAQSRRSSTSPPAEHRAAAGNRTGGAEEARPSEAVLDPSPAPASGIQLGNPFCIHGMDPEQLLVLAAVVSHEAGAGPLDGIARGLSLPSGWVVLSSQRFNPLLGRGEVMVEDRHGKISRISAGDPEAILALCDAAATETAALREAVQVFSEAGYRSVAVAQTDPAGRWRALGVVPVRE